MNPHVQLVLGQTGYGKTTLVRQELVKDRPRVVGFDVRQEYDMLSLPWEEFRAYVDRMPLDTFHVTTPDASEHADDFCALVYALGEVVAERTGDTITALLEEANLLRKGDGPASLLRLVAQGRIYTGRRGGIEVIAVVRRPTEVPPIIRNMADEVYVFRTQEPDDVLSFIGSEATAAVQTFQHPRATGIAEYIAWAPSGWSRRQLAVGR